jgi:hypothetical protein
LEASRERRASERFIVEGAKVLFQQEKSFKILERYSQPLPLKDISESGVRFQVDQYLGPGSLVDLQISVPGLGTIGIKGHVVWIARQEPYDHYHVGVQFLPFGEGYQYNSPTSRDKLDQLINRYIH